MRRGKSISFSKYVDAATDAVVLKHPSSALNMTLPAFAAERRRLSIDETDRQTDR